jgi:hypothetical protein
MHIKEKLMNIQVELKANKSRYNKFGDYHHRNLEDIYESVKPLLFKYKLTLLIDNELHDVCGKIFRKSIATLMDVESDDVIKCSTYVQESLEAKGLAPEQNSGKSSSYGDKYCLNKLFCLDDTKDADASNDHGKEEKAIDPKNSFKKPSKSGF